MRVSQNQTGTTGWSRENTWGRGGTTWGRHNTWGRLTTWG
jgi:hypothetical protein